MSEVIAVLDANAFAGVMFVLVFTVLVAFMTGVLGCSGGVSADIPRVRYVRSLPGMRRESALIVLVFRTGDVFFDNNRVCLSGLDERIRRQLRVGAERKVYLRVDVRTHWARVGQVLDQVRAAGIADISFVVDQNK